MLEQCSVLKKMANIQNNLVTIAQFSQRMFAPLYLAIILCVEVESRAIGRGE